MSPTVEKDDPAQYQGRTLARPKVQGDYPTHIYLSFDIPPFFRTLVKEAQADLPELHSLLDSPSNNQPPTDQAELDTPKRDKEKETKLHVSLSRPLYLRADRKSAVEASLRDVVRTIKSFPLSFSTLSVFKNDDNTRTFLSIDVGAGFPELEVLTESLNKSLDKHHLPPYYTSPRFHTSIAWALLTPSSNPSSHLPKSTLIPSIQHDRSNKPDQKSFPSIEGIPPDLVKKLDEKFGDRIRKEGPWLVDEVVCSYKGMTEIARHVLG
ncbi:upf0406 family protein [Phaffia rhodozyma]|uniref:U6 snRNA phosphodiesterase 1 n=1 Tax=Phaffia rhodozyma TaxID=264483 RepID=A0A0F7SL63_PHARH|nr:upf0406 family protein [Phaffia rhodozyma]